MESDVCCAGGGIAIIIVVVVAFPGNNVKICSGGVTERAFEQSMQVPFGCHRCAWHGRLGQHRTLCLQ